MGHDTTQGDCSPCDRLPLVQSPSIADSGQTKPNATVLVVDDDPSIRNLLSQWLEEEGYRCLPTSNAAEAIQYYSPFHMTLRYCQRYSVVKLGTLGILANAFSFRLILVGFGIFSPVAVFFATYVSNGGGASGRSDFAKPLVQMLSQTVHCVIACRRTIVVNDSPTNFNRLKFGVILRRS